MKNKQNFLKDIKADIDAELQMHGIDPDKSSLSDHLMEIVKTALLATKKVNESVIEVQCPHCGVWNDLSYKSPCTRAICTDCHEEIEVYIH